MFNGCTTITNIPKDLFNGEYIIDQGIILQDNVASIGLEDIIDERINKWLEERIQATINVKVDRSIETIFEQWLGKRLDTAIRNYLHDLYETPDLKIEDAFTAADLEIEKDLEAPNKERLRTKIILKK